MKKTSIALLVGGGITLFGSLCFFIGMFMLGFDFDNLTVPSVSAREITLSFTEEITGIQIEDTHSNILVAPADGDTCYVNYPDTNRGTHEAVLENGILKISFEPSKNWYDYIQFFSLTDQSSYLNVYLPRGEYDALDLSAKSGNITVSEGPSFTSADITLASGNANFSAEVSSALKIETVSGNIEVFDISLSGAALENLDLSAASGTVRLSGAEAKKASIKTASGNIRVNSVRFDSFNANASSGNIKIADSRLAQCNIKAASGNIDLNRIWISDASFEAASGNIKGSLTVKPIFIPNSGSGRIKIPENLYGSEGTVRVTTASGNISFSAP